MTSEAEILNRIENKIRNNKKVYDREVYLLLECYTTYGVKIPKDIYKKVKGFL